MCKNAVRSLWVWSVITPLISFIVILLCRATWDYKRLPRLTEDLVIIIGCVLMFFAYQVTTKDITKLWHVTLPLFCTANVYLSVAIVFAVKLVASGVSEATLAVSLLSVAWLAAFFGHLMSYVLIPHGELHFFVVARPMCLCLLLCSATLLLLPYFVSFF